MKFSLLLTLLIMAGILLPPAAMNSTLAQEADRDDQIGEVSNDGLADQVPSDVRDRIEDVKDRVDADPQAQEATENILTPIKEFGNTIVSLPGFYWIAFAMMTAGLVSYLLQLVLGKLVMLTQFHFNLTEILSDGLGLLISATGLVLLTQAATTEGRFIDRPSLVLTAAAVGAVLGLIFYFRGQTQELREARAIAASRKQKNG